MLLIWLHGSILAKQNPIKGYHDFLRSFSNIFSGIFESLCHINRRDLAEQIRTKANHGPNDEKSCSIQ